MELPLPCRTHIDAFCPRCGFVHECVAGLPDDPVTDISLARLRERGIASEIDAIAAVPIEKTVGFDHLADHGAAWVANELVVTENGRSRTLVYIRGDWVVTGVVSHEPTDDAKTIHHCVCALASVASPGDTLDDLPFEFDD